MFQFSYSEIDSLYKWSRRGGKLIICASSGDGAYNPAILNSKWGFQVLRAVPSSFIPSSTGLATAIFNGPFGAIDSAKQSGTMQGYFSTLPTNVSILATDRNNHPTIIMDCNTLDLIVADVDGFTSLDGTVTTGSSISSDQDRYFLNSIAFMDLLQPLPEIINSGGVLSLNSSYNNYQWFINDSSWAGAINPTAIAADSGSYSVEVTLNGGCKVKSNPFVVASPIGINEVANNTLFQLFPNPGNGTFSIEYNGSECYSLVIMDELGKEVYSAQLCGTQNTLELNLDNGIYLLRVKTEESGKVIYRKLMIVN